MSSPANASPETLSLAELRELVGALLAKVAELGSANTALKAENQALRDEVARLKGLSPRPPLRPSGMEKATGGAEPTKSGKRSRRRRGAKRDRDAMTAERVAKAAPPPGSRFKGYQDMLVRELTTSAEVVRCRRERWAAPSGETVLAPLPAGILGGFGPRLRRFPLVAHAQGQVTTERLVALLGGIGIGISKRQAQSRRCRIPSTRPPPRPDQTPVPRHLPRLRRTTSSPSSSAARTTASTPRRSPKPRRGRAWPASR
ncbi:MAG: hypothetical protein K2X49_07555 [Acetobacteraceae bacterium]|nr:hypothetical protein [Acetobacteraceae bacterium]